MLLLIMEMAFSMAALVDLAPRGPVQWLAATVTSLALLAQIAWLDRASRQRGTAHRRDPVSERLAEVGLHPALIELAVQDPESAARLQTSRRRTRRRRNRGRRRRSASARAET
jgi:hypothetical protein